jgi:hypothetical protein
MISSAKEPVQRLRRPVANVRLNGPSRQAPNHGPAWKTSFLAVICMLLTGCRPLGANAGPTIEFSRVPQAAEGGPDRVENIEGRVIGARSGQRIVLFARSKVWWVQPFADQPFTPIQPDSKWKSATHLGTEYAALLVEPGFRPPPTMDALPTVGGDVAAVAIAKGEVSPSTISKTLNFSGYEWTVRSAASDRGGTTNVYDPANAWTDAGGALHLRIAQRAGQWTCAEARLARSLGYGSYLFVVREASHLEPAAVLSMFTWDDLGADQNHREIGIDLAHWGDPASKNAQYLIQPYYVPTNVTRFMAPSGVLTHSFRWEPGRVAFRTTHGKTIRGVVGGGGSNVVAKHVFTSGVPVPGGESVHLSLYVFGSSRTPLQNETEVVIEKFEYLP